MELLEVFLEKLQAAFIEHVQFELPLEYAEEFSTPLPVITPLGFIEGLYVRIAWNSSTRIFI